MRKTPEFWGKPRGLWSEILLPLAILPFLYSRFREKIATKISFAVPIICVGNATVGGAGKTPVAIAIAKEFSQQNKKYAFVSKGYKGKLEGPVKVDLAKHSAHDVGDEPLLLARHAACWVAKNRVSGIKAAIAAGADGIILDDGLQDCRVQKNLSFLVIDGGYGFGNGLLLPAGPLRDRPDIAFREADAVILIGEDRHGILEQHKPAIPVIKSSIQADNTESLDKDKSYVAFAGIGRPEKFLETLEELELNIVDAISFPDHFAYKKEHCTQLEITAEKQNSTLITTEKDMVRLPEYMRKKVQVLSISIKWQQPKIIRDLLKKTTK